MKGIADRKIYVLEDFYYFIEQSFNLPGLCIHTFLKYDLQQTLVFA